MSRNGMLEICEKWRERQQHIPDSYLGDIYDGEVWKTFETGEYQHYLTFPHSLMLALNVDVADTGRKRTLFHSKWLNSSSYISRMLY